MWLKIFTRYEDEEWIVKLPPSVNCGEIGEVEYRCGLYAAKCGLEVPEIRLFPSKRCTGYFGTQRFDQVKDQKGNEKRIHMLSASGILGTYHRIPNLDYHFLMKLTLLLMKDYRQMEKLYRQMCFNVFAHNRDDHSRNFSFLYARVLDSGGCCRPKL